MEFFYWELYIVFDEYIRLDLLQKSSYSIEISQAEFPRVDSREPKEHYMEREIDSNNKCIGYLTKSTLSAMLPIGGKTFSKPRIGFSYSGAPGLDIFHTVRFFTTFFCDTARFVASPMVRACG